MPHRSSSALHMHEAVCFSRKNQHQRLLPILEEKREREREKRKTRGIKSPLLSDSESQSRSKVDEIGSRNRKGSRLQTGRIEKDPADTRSSSQASSGLRQICMMSLDQASKQASKRARLHDKNEVQLFASSADLFILIAK